MTFPTTKILARGLALRLTLACLFFTIPFRALPQQNGPERWEDSIAKFERDDQRNPQEPGALLFVGSSSIAMWADVGDYFPGYRILNRGFGGSNFSDLLYYAHRLIYPYHPSRIFIYEGDNDLAAGDDPNEILATAKKLRKQIRDNLGDTPVVFISPKPSIARWGLREKYETLNTKLKAYAMNEPNTEFADVWTPAIGPDGKVLSHIFKSDNLHMNADGYKIWQKVLLPYVKGDGK